MLLAFARLTYHPGAPFLKALATQVGFVVGGCMDGRASKESRPTSIQLITNQSLPPLSSTNRHQQAAACLPRFTTQGLANTLNAFAKFSFDPGARFWQRVGLLLFTTNDNERTKATLSLTLFEVRTDRAPVQFIIISRLPPVHA